MKPVGSLAGSSAGVCLALATLSFCVWRFRLGAEYQVREYVEEHEELKTALTKWGTWKTGFQM